MARFMLAGGDLNLGILKNPSLNQLAPSKAFLGPHIGKCCYQVSKDFLKNFPKSTPYFPKERQLPHFCLKSEATNQLKFVFPASMSRYLKNAPCAQSH